MGNKFQDGFAQGLTVRGIPLLQAYPGKVFWVNGSSVIPKDGIAGVDGGGTNSRPGTGSYKRPFATIDYAIGRCLASRGDIIAVMPGYTQNLTAAADIALDVAGVAIVGLGTGSLRPQLSYPTTADGTFAITAANCAVIGFDFIANFADVTTAVTVSAAGLGTSFESCNFTEAGTDLNWLACVTLTTLAHDQSFINCTFISSDVACVSFITGVVHDRLYIEGCRFYQNAAQTVLTALVVGSDVTSSVIRDSSFRSNKDHAKFIGLSGTATGTIWGCSFSSIDTAGATGSAGSGYVTSGCHCHNCYVSGDANGWAIEGGGTAIAAN